MAALKVFIVAAEASGDRLGADLIKALRSRSEEISFAGIGGKRMAEERVDSPFDISELSVLGIIEGLKAYPHVVKRVREATAAIQRFDPDVVVLIDSWGFTLRVAQALRKIGSRARLIKYIGPQVWASRPGRAKTLAKTVDHLLCIYDIETQYYAPYGLPCTVVGNPVANAPIHHGDGDAFRRAHNIAFGTPLLLVLFGSRPAEVERLGPTFLETVKRLRSVIPDLRMMTFAADTVSGRVKQLMTNLPDALVLTDEAQKQNVFAAATVALACSGSVTTELALQGAPIVVGYRVGAITAFLIRRFLFKGRFVTLLNIAADDEIVPEFLQEDCRPEALTPVLQKLLTDKVARDVQLGKQNAALQAMGRGKPSAASIAADVILQQSLTR
ncbi:MAG: lipid-A-disaccharide synthase [Caulobacterales bacterium]